MLLEALLIAGMWTAATQGIGVSQKEPVVLFVCEHGSVKSLMARLLFEREAEKVGLRAQAISRGITPDAAVPEKVREALEQDGFDIGAWLPSRLAEQDTRLADHLVLFDVRLPDGPSGAGRVEHWDQMPAVSADYARARDAIRARVEALVKRLKRLRNSDTSSNISHPLSSPLGLELALPARAAGSPTSSRRPAHLTEAVLK